MAINRISSVPVLYRQREWGNLSIVEYHQEIGTVTYPTSSDHRLHIMLSDQPAFLSRTLGNEVAYGSYHEGDIALLPSGDSMCDQWENSGYCLQIQISASLLQELAQDILGTTETLMLFPVLKRVDLELLSISKMLLMATKQELPGEARYVHMLSELIAMHLIREYSTQCPVPEPRTGLAKHQVEIIKQYIHQHLQSEIRLPDLAQLLGMSPFHFSRIFKQTMDISPYQYVIRQRIEQVKALLKDRPLSLTDVALETGFNSQSHMGTCFKQMTGMTPTDYRNQCHATQFIKQRRFISHPRMAPS